MVVQHNIPSMNAKRNLTKNNNALSGNLEKLSSGYRINRAGDDTAGLAISEKMRAQISGLDQAYENVEDGINLIKTGEGAMQEIHDMLHRLKELSVQSANGTYDDEVDREAIQEEVDALILEVDRISDSTNFNGIHMLNGTDSVNNYDFYDLAQESLLEYYDYGLISGGEEISGVNFTGLSGADLIGSTMVIDFHWEYTNATFTQKVTINFTDDENADITEDGQHLMLTGKTDYTMYIDPSMDAVDAVKSFILDTGPEASWGSVAASDVLFFETKSDNLSETNIYASSDKNYISGPNNGYQIDKTGLADMLASSGYSQVTNLYFIRSDQEDETDVGEEFNYDKEIVLQIGDTGDDFNKLGVPIFNLHANNLGVDPFDLTTQESAKDCIGKVGKAVNLVSRFRGIYGASQNRLEHTKDNLSTMEENIQDAESAIRDTDVALEMMAYTKNNILIQSSQAMLAQANSQPEGLLQLLG